MQPRLPHQPLAVMQRLPEPNIMEQRPPFPPTPHISTEGGPRMVVSGTPPHPVVRPHQAPQQMQVCKL